MAELEKELSELIKTAKIMHKKLAIEAVATSYAYELLEIKKDSPTDNAFDAIKKLKTDNARMREVLENLMNKVSDNYGSTKAYDDACKVLGVRNEWYDEEGGE